MPHRKKNVLVVDDDTVVHFLSERIMTSFSWINQIYKAANGKEGIHLLNEYCRGLISPPHIILLDLHMPVMDGFQFLHELNNMKCLESKDIITIVFSSTTDPSDIQRIRDLGIRHHFPKPISQQAIREVLQQEWKRGVI